MNDFAKVNIIYSSYFKQDEYPARVCYAVQALPKNSKVEIDAIAVQGKEVEKKEEKAWFVCIFTISKI